MVKVKRLVYIGIVLGVLTFPTSSFASTGNSATHQSQTYSAIQQFFSSCFGNNGGNGSWDWGGGKDDQSRNGDDCSDSYDIWQQWYCN